MKSTFRLSVLGLLLVLALLGVGLWIYLATPTELSVVEWPYYDDPNIWQDFKTNHSNVKMNWKILEKDSTIFSEIQGASPGTYDVVHPYTSWLQRYVDAGLVEVIDTDKLTNWKEKVPDALKAIGRCGPSKYELRCSPALNGKQFFIAWDIGLSSILYRTDKVEKVRSWSWLLDPRYGGHISMFKDGPSAVAVSTYMHPDKYNEKDITDEQLNEIQEEWTRQKPLNLKYWDHEVDLIHDMTEGVGTDKEEGVVWMAYAWPSAYEGVKTALKEKVEAGKVEKGVDVAYADPVERRASWVGVYGIVKGTKNLDLAMQFLDDKLADATSMNLVNNFHYAVSNQVVMREMTDATVKELFPVDIESMLFDKEDGGKALTNFTPELTNEQHDEWPGMWERVLRH